MCRSWSASSAFHERQALNAVTAAHLKYIVTGGEPLHGQNKLSCCYKSVPELEEQDSTQTDSQQAQLAHAENTN